MAKKVMTRAWEIAREAVKAFGGRAVEYISTALKMAWEEIKMAEKAVVDRIEDLEALGFNRWTKGNMDRLYINAAQLGLVCEYYKTGNVSSAWFKGNMVSNCEARRMKGSKTFIDIKTERVYSDNETLRKAAAELAGLEA